VTPALVLAHKSFDDRISGRAGELIGAGVLGPQGEPKVHDALSEREPALEADVSKESWDSARDRAEMQTRLVIREWSSDRS
jgi:hypothetical protein